MELNPGKRKVYLRPGATDLRKSINTLSVIVESNMKKDPYSESLYLFCNKRKDKLKALLGQNRILPLAKEVGGEYVSVAEYGRGSE
ncbi:IS66 family element, Orf2 domain protein [Leptospira kirschneri str. H2]|nr:IS66 family element, Orf2 domain protein [Leptospira kirschneri str. H2]